MNAEAEVQCGADVLTALASNETVDGGGLTNPRIAAMSGRDRALVARIVRSFPDPFGNGDGRPMGRRAASAKLGA